MTTNVAQRRGPHLRTLTAVMRPAWLATAAVTLGLPVPASAGVATIAYRLLGAVLVPYGLWRPRLPAPGPHTRWVGLAMGGATGAVTAATTVFVLLLVPYLLALRLDKDGVFQALERCPSRRSPWHWRSA